MEDVIAGTVEVSAGTEDVLVGTEEVIAGTEEVIAETEATLFGDKAGESTSSNRNESRDRKTV